MKISDAAFEFLKSLVRERFGIVVGDPQRPLAELRLAPIVTKHGLESFDQLVDRIRTESTLGPLTRLVLESLTTNETSFFRDADVYRALQTVIWPELAQRTTRTLQVWSAASSTGQEPYSLAMSIVETPALRARGVEITATDVAKAMVERTASGVFSATEVARGLSNDRLERHFDGTGSTWKAKPHLREMIRCFELNLTKAWPELPSFDLVLLRNVLIYFDVATKSAILERICARLAPHSYIFLGSSETPLGLSTRLVPVRIENAVAYRLDKTVTARCFEQPL